MRQMTVVSCRGLKNGVTVEWWDNFNRWYSMGVKTLANNSVRSGDWTVRGFRVPATPCYIDVTLTPLMCTMPDDPLERSVVSTVLEYCMVHAYNETFLAKSFATKLSVNRVPVKPDMKNCHTTPAVRKRVRERGSSMKFFHPEGIEPVNIGENRGLCKIVKSWLDEHRQARHPRMRMICVDIDIYWRIAKVSSACA
jgi:hypothetical protein